MNEQIEQTMQNIKLAPKWVDYPLNWAFFSEHMDLYVDYGLDWAGMYFMGNEL